MTHSHLKRCCVNGVDMWNQKLLKTQTRILSIQPSKLENSSKVPLCSRWREEGVPLFAIWDENIFNLSHNAVKCHKGSDGCQTRRVKSHLFSSSSSRGLRPWGEKRCTAYSGNTTASLCRSCGREGKLHFCSAFASTLPGYYLGE